MMRILLVDNDKTELMGMCEHLQSKGFEVGVAHCATKAMKELDQADPLPDIISINLYMPGFVGWVLLQKLAKDDRFKNINIVITNVNEIKSHTMSFDSAELAVYFIQESDQMNDYFAREWQKSKKSTA